MEKIILSNSYIILEKIIREKETLIKFEIPGRGIGLPLPLTWYFVGAHVTLKYKLFLTVFSWFGSVSSDGSTESGERHKLMKLKNSQLTCARSVKSWQTLREYIRISPTYCEWGRRILRSSCFSGFVRSTKTYNKSFCVANIFKEIVECSYLKGKINQKTL